MYNAFTVRKKTIEIQQMKKKSQANQRYVNRYYNITRPALIDSHNKRINSFIRKMEEEPIQVNIDPYCKSNQKNKLNSGRIQDKRSRSNLTYRRESSSDQYQALSPHQQTFKFKDNEDWRSLLTPLERIQRLRNFQLFKSKYGDPTLAYRSIGSQSQYNPGHEFRQRNKGLQINPPMKYTNKPTKQVLAKLKNKYKHRNQKEQNRIDQNKPITNERQQDVLVRRNTGSSLSGLGQDVLMSDNMDRISKHEHSDKQTENIHENSGKGIKSKKQIKLHFKQIMDLEQNISDIKTKKALRQILYKCGVYKRKNRRVATDSEIDKLSEFTDGRDYTRDH